MVATMKVRCMDANGYNGHLTEGKVYEAKDDGPYYQISDGDDGREVSTWKRRFKIVPESVAPSVPIAESSTDSEAKLRAILTGNSDPSQCPCGRPREGCTYHG